MGPTSLRSGAIGEASGGTPQGSAVLRFLIVVRSGPCRRCDSCSIVEGHLWSLLMLGPPFMAGNVRATAMVVFSPFTDRPIIIWTVCGTQEKSTLSRRDISYYPVVRSAATPPPDTKRRKSNLHPGGMPAPLQGETADAQYLYLFGLPLGRHGCSVACGLSR
jgi:hypothetical protein